MAGMPILQDAGDRPAPYPVTETHRILPQTSTGQPGRQSRIKKNPSRLPCWGFGYDGDTLSGVAHDLDVLGKLEMKKAPIALATGAFE